MSQMEPTSSIADVQMHYILLIQEKGSEVHAASCQHGFVGLKVNTVHHEGAVAQQALLTLPVQLLQNLPAVPGELHLFQRSSYMRATPVCLKHKMDILLYYLFELK